MGDRRKTGDERAFDRHVSQENVKLLPALA